MRAFQTLVVLNAFREVGRLIMTNAAYYLTAADVVGEGTVVKRDAALVLPLAFNTFMAVIFRLEVSNFDSEGVATMTLLAQAAYEIVSRLTAPERDEWAKAVMRKLRKLCCCGSREQRRSTVLVVSIASSVSVAPYSSGTPPSAKQSSARHERLAGVHERHAVIKECRSAERSEAQRSCTKVMGLANGTVSRRVGRIGGGAR